MVNHLSTAIDLQPLEYTKGLMEIGYMAEVTRSQVASNCM